MYAGLLTPGETLSVVATGSFTLRIISGLLVIILILSDKPGTLGRGRVGVDGTLLDEEGRSWSSLKGFKINISIF